MKAKLIKDGDEGYIVDDGEREYYHSELRDAQRHLRELQFK